MASEEGAPEAEDHSPLPPAPKTRKMADSFVSFDLLFEDDKKLLEVCHPSRALYGSPCKN